MNRDKRNQHRNTALTDELARRLRPPDEKMFKIEDAFVMAVIKEKVLQAGKYKYRIQIEGELSPRKKLFRASVKPEDLNNGDMVFALKGYRTYTIFAKIY